MRMDSARSEERDQGRVGLRRRPLKLEDPAEDDVEVLRACAAAPEILAAREAVDARGGSQSLEHACADTPEKPARSDRAEEHFGSGVGVEWVHARHEYRTFSRDFPGTILAVASYYPRVFEKPAPPEHG